MLSIGEQRQALYTMLTSMLIMITETIHVFVAALTVSNSAGKRAEASLSLFLDFLEIGLCDTIFCGKLGSGSGGTGGGSGERQAETDNPFALAGSLALFPLEKIFDMLEVLRRSKVAAAMGHVILETVGLLVALVAVGLGTFERFAEQEGGICTDSGSRRNWSSGDGSSDFKEGGKNGGTRDTRG